MKAEQTEPEALTPAEQAAIDQVIAAHQRDATQLVGILLDVQAGTEGGYISQRAAVYVAHRLGLKLTQVYDVITFYAALYDAPRARYPLEVCESAPCHVNGAPALLDLLRETLGVGPGETTPDGRFSVRTVPCFGACDAAPAVRCRGAVYGPLTTRQAVEDMLKTLEGGER